MQKKQAERLVLCYAMDYAILDSAAIDKHLRGKVVYGIYPMLPDETCFFLAMDFDDEGWQRDIKALRDICIKKNIPIAVERSQSGNGAHAWFFFKDKISAVDARKFGTLLLTNAMSERHEIKFSSYDRLFPNQDTLPRGGFGNLIALPLQGNARKNKNSVFFDEDFKPYDDQWNFLSNMRTLSDEDVVRLKKWYKSKGREMKRMSKKKSQALSVQGEKQI